MQDLRIGDLVEYHGDRWFVTRVDRSVRTVILRKFDNVAEEVPNNDPECRVIANLPSSWPFIAAPRHSKAGPIDRITISRGGTPKLLRPMIAWVPSEALHNGGVIYFHPLLDLKQGEVLVAHHRSQHLSRLNITPTYGTAQRRLALEERRRAPPPPQTRYDVLLVDEEDE